VEDFRRRRSARRPALGRRLDDDALERVRQLARLAEDLGITMPQLALA